LPSAREREAGAVKSFPRGQPKDIEKEKFMLIIAMPGFDTGPCHELLGFVRRRKRNENELY